MSGESNQVLWEVRMEIAPEASDDADTLLLEMGDERWSLLEDVIARRAWIIGVFESEDAAANARAEISSLLTFQLKHVDLRPLPACEWRDSYKAHFHAWRFGHLHWVPVWEKATYQLPEGDLVLWLDPGLAFGTGNHETTRLCVERLVEHAQTVGTQGRVVDAGCGSGILALSAARLGYQRVAAFDNDAEAIRVSLDNTALNDLAGQVEFNVGDLTTGFREPPAHVVMANILANVLIQFANELTRSVVPGGWLILSGILSEECDRVRQVFRNVVPHWKQESRRLGEWSDVLLIRPADDA